MNNLYQTIIDYSFLSQRDNPTVVIGDCKPSGILPNHIQFIGLEQERLATIRTSDTIIGIANQLNSKDILTINTTRNIAPTRITLNPGLHSLITKNNSEYNDITTLQTAGYTVIEPYNETSIQTYMKPKHYLQIFDTNLADEIVQLKSKNGYTLLHKSDNSNQYTIITTAHLVDRVASSLHRLHEDYKIEYDLYVQELVSSQLPHTLITSIQNSKKVVIILDHRATEEIWIYYEQVIKNNMGSQKSNIHFLFPQFHLVQSILPEYIEEEAYFDQKAITEYLYSVFDIEG